MITTKKELEIIKALFKKESNREIIVRLFADALLASTTITAPEIRLCISMIENTLALEENEEVRDVKLDRAE